MISRFIFYNCVLSTSECESVERREAQFGDCGTMVACGVTFVYLPAVTGILLCRPAHPLVTMGLGEDRCSCDIAQLAVTFYYCLIRDVAIGFETVAVNHYLSRRHAESVESTVHGENRGVEDVD